MTRYLLILMNAAVCAQLCVAAPLQTESRKGHKTYDFFYDARYPGYRRSDVGVDKVSQEGDDTLNPRLQGWLRRAKPYRYAAPGPQ
jgi:hypothetical protein